MHDDLRNDPIYSAWEAAVRADCLPKLRDSALTVSLAPKGDPDIKYAVELGLSIMMDKPIILIVAPGQEIPRKLRDVADAIVDVDWDNFGTNGGAERIQAAIDEMMARLDLD